MYKICRAVAKNIDRPTGCRSQSCLAHHTPAEHPQKYYGKDMKTIHLFIDLFNKRKKADNPAIVLDKAKFEKWLELRNDNRKRITRFTSLEKLNADIPDHTVFHKIKCRQIEIFKMGTTTIHTDSKAQIIDPLDALKTWYAQASKSFDFVKHDAKYDSVLIGEGAIGQVYRVELESKDSKDSKLVLAKKVSCKDEEMEAEFRNRKNLGDAILTGIITFIGFHKDAIFMRYYSHSLKDLTSILTEEQKKLWLPRILYQLSIGLDTIHSRNYLHNDVKIRNILVNCNTSNYDDVSSLEIVLGDLGATKMRCEPSYGTEVYQASEIIEYDCYNSTRSDVCSLGLSMIEFIEGNRDRFNDYILHINHLPATFPLRSLIKSMIHHDSNKRPYAFQIIQLLNERDQGSF